jgi:hypothetical protein
MLAPFRLVDAVVRAHAGMIFKCLDHAAKGFFVFRLVVLNRAGVADADEAVHAVAGGGVLPGLLAREGGVVPLRFRADDAGANKSRAGGGEFIDAIAAPRRLRLRLRGHDEADEKNLSRGGRGGVDVEDGVVVDADFCGGARGSRRRGEQDERNEDDGNERESGGSLGHSGFQLLPRCRGGIA